MTEIETVSPEKQALLKLKKTVLADQLINERSDKRSQVEQWQGHYKREAERHSSANEARFVAERKLRETEQKLRALEIQNAELQATLAKSEGIVVAYEAVIGVLSGKGAEAFQSPPHAPEKPSLKGLGVLASMLDPFVGMKNR